MTWKEFKASVENKGVTDETDLTYIDIGPFDEVEVKLHDGEATITGNYITEEMD